MLRVVDRDVLHHEVGAGRPVRMVLHFDVEADLAFAARRFAIVVTQLLVLALQVQVIVVVSHPDESEGEAASDATGCLNYLIDFVSVETGLGRFLEQYLVLFLSTIVVDLRSELLQEVVLRARVQLIDPISHAARTAVDRLILLINQQLIPH